jgi:hypothetical protein
VVEEAGDLVHLDVVGEEREDVRRHLALACVLGYQKKGRPPIQFYFSDGALEEDRAQKRCERSM